MRRPRLAALVACAALVGAGAAQAYVLSPTDENNAQNISWDLQNSGTFRANIENGQITYRIDGAGSADVADGTDIEAVERAFETWSGVNGSSLRFRRGPDLNFRSALGDGEFPVFWNESSTIIDQGTADPSDDMSIAGALAVTFVYRMISGPETGEIADANIVFNGAEFAWTTDPAGEPSRFDIESVAVHEIGHALGLEHSAVAGASLFPRLAAGRSEARSLSPDDVAGLRAVYPGAGILLTTGEVTGVLTAGAPVFGGLIWLRDAAGRVVGSTLSQPDGSYRIRAVRPGEYTLHAQPVNEASGFFLFSALNLSSFYAGLDRGFFPPPPGAVSVQAGQQTVANLLATPGTPVADLKLIARNGRWSNVGVTARPGETLTIAVAGAGVPLVGSPLSIPGTGVTVNSTSYTAIAGFPAVTVGITIAPDAAVGTRDLVVAGPDGPATAVAGLEILPAVWSDPLPADVGTLHLTAYPGGVELRWSPAPGAEWYRVYSGTAATLRSGFYDHQPVSDGCHVTLPEASVAAEGASGVLYFLASAVSQAGESSLGRSSPGAERPTPLQACP